MMHPPGNVTTATILSVDIVESTQTRIRLGEELADRHFSRAYQLFLAVVQQGRAVFTRSRGDGLTAVFESVAAGFDAVLAMQQELLAENRYGLEPIVIRAALSVGDVHWTRDEIEGLALVEASRLMDGADGGQVLCTAQARALTQRRPQYTFRHLGERTAKGLPEPLQVHEFVWRDCERPERLPPWLTNDPTLPMVGRQTVLDALINELDQATRTTRRVHLQGDQGEGKTRLIAQVAREALDKDFIVMASRCHRPARRAHEPISAAIRHVAQTAGVQLLRAQVADPNTPLTALDPPATGSPAGGSPAGGSPAGGSPAGDRPDLLAIPGTARPGSDRAQLIADISQLIDQLAELRPVLLLIDDLQWASPESLQILQALHWERPPRLLIMTTSRPMSAHPTAHHGHDHGANEQDPSAGELRRVQATSRVIEIGPLGHADIAQLLAAKPLPAEARADTGRLMQITGGNPFLLTEVFREVTSGTDLEAMAVPDPLQQLIQARLEQLGGPARQIAELLAIGERLHADVLRAATGLDESGFVDAEMRLMAAGLLTRSPGLRFQLAHELTRKAVQATIPQPRIGLLHGRLADLLLRFDPAIADTQPYVVATHLIAAAQHAHDVSRAGQAAQAAVQAARHALARLAYSEAVTWYRQHLTQLDSTPRVPAEQRAQALVECGQAMWLAGDPQARPMLNIAAGKARECSRHDLVIAAAVAGDRGFFSITAQHDQDRIALLEEALRLVEPTDHNTRALLVAQLASELTWAPSGDQRFALSDTALKLARRAGDPRTLVSVLGLRSLTMVPSISLEQRQREATEMLEAARKTGDDLLLFHATFHKLAPMLDIGNTTDQARWLGKAADLAGRLAQPHLNWLIAFSQAGLSLMQGDLAAAHTQARHARQLGREVGRQYEADPFYTEQLAEIRRLRGQLDTLRAPLRRARDLIELDPVHAILRYLYELGDDSTGPLLDQIITTQGPHPRHDMARRPALDNLALAATQHGTPDLIATLYEALTPHADTFGHSAVAHHCGHHYLAHLAAATQDTKLAAEHFEAAAQIHERSGVPLLSAESWLDWAALADASSHHQPLPPNLREHCTELLAGRGATLLENRLARL